MGILNEIARNGGVPLAKEGLAEQHRLVRNLGLLLYGVCYRMRLGAARRARRNARQRRHLSWYLLVAMGLSESR